MIGPNRWGALALVAFVGCSGGSSDATSEGGDSASPSDSGGDVDALRPQDAAIDATTSVDTGISPATDSGAAADDAMSDVIHDASSDAAVPDYTQTGPHPVTTADSTVAGNAVHLVYPSDAPPAGGFDGIAFAHGFQLQTNAYDKLLTHLASWGYVVVSTDYPGSLFSIDHRDVATALTAARTAMANGTIAGLPKVAASKIAAAGHSLGGKGAVMAVLADASFAAALTFDPVDGNPGNPLGGGADAAHPQLNPTQVATLSVPMGYFGATQSHCGSNPCAPTGLDAAEFFKNTPASTPHYLWTVFDFGHMQFLDNPSCGFVCSVCAAGKSAVDPRVVAVHATSVAFLRRHLDGDATAATWLDGAKLHDEIAAGLFWDGTSAKPGC